MQETVIIAVSIVLAVIIFLAGKVVWNWYNRQNEVVDALLEIRDILKKGLPEQTKPE